MNKFLLIPTRALAVVALMAAWSLPIQAEDDMGYGDPNSEYDAAKARCDGMSSSQRDTCLKQAKKIRESKEPGHKAEDKELNQDYQADKKKCDALVGDERDNCMQNLSNKYQR